MSGPRSYRAGESIEDYCRACKTDRMHTVVVVDGDGRPIRVDCGYCHSEHNYRGGPKIDRSRASTHEANVPHTRGAQPGRVPFPIVSDRERIAAPMTVSESAPGDLEM